MSIYGNPVMMGGSGGGDIVLPSAYKRVDYIESSGTQYINTGVLINPDYSTEVDCCISEIVSEFDYPFACRDNASGWPGYYGCFFYKSSPGYLAFRHAPASDAAYESFNSTLTKADALDTYHVIGLYGNVAKIDGQALHTFASTTSTATLQYPLYLFAMNASNQTLTECFSHIKMRYAKIWDGSNTLVRYLVPCVRKEDQVAGMFDLVYGSFYTNSGTGAFVAGPETGGGGTEDISIYGDLFKYCLLSTDSTDQFSRNDRWFKRNSDEPIIVLGTAFISSGSMTYTGYAVISFTGTAVTGTYSSYGDLSTPPRTATTPLGTTFYIQQINGMYPPSSASNKINLQFGTNSNNAKNVLEFVIDDTKLIHEAGTSTFEGDPNLLQAFYEFIDSVYQKYYT